MKILNLNGKLPLVLMRYATLVERVENKKILFCAITYCTKTNAILSIVNSGDKIEQESVIVFGLFLFQHNQQFEEQSNFMTPFYVDSIAHRLPKKWNE